jgi:hypothetical protein
MNSKAVHANIITPTKKKAVLLQGTIQYVLPLGNGWVVKSSTASKFTVITESKREASSIARNIAKTKHSQLIIYNKDGSIEREESY